LNGAAMFMSQELPLFLGFHALRNDLEPQGEA
jgi:hypothetical protein